MTDDTRQRDIFLRGEGDAYFQRNAQGYGIPDAPQPDSLPLQVATRYAPAAARVLEIGCANGLNLARLRQLTGARGAGVDPSGAAIDAGKNQHPDLDLRLGTADALPFGDAAFDLVWFGFCLYVTDRPLLPRVVAEADRVLADGGFLMIVDFDPDVPVRRGYHHASGVSTHKLDHARMFLGFPQYTLVEKRPFSHTGDAFHPDPAERLAVLVLRKDNAGGYATLAEPPPSSP